MCLTAMLGCASDTSDTPSVAESTQVIRGTAPPAAGGLQSVITLDPLPHRDAPVPSDTVVMDQFELAFLPSLLVVRAGQPVEFRNSENVVHNVTVVDTTGTTLINTITPFGDPHYHIFESAGGYAVTCVIHPGMTAFVLAVSAPYAVTAENNGEFSIADVPAGTYALTVWNFDPANRLVGTVQIAEGQTDLGSLLP